MTELRKRAMGLYPLLDASDKKYALKAKKLLDRALTNTTGLIDRMDPKVLELVYACDFASTILSN